MSVRITTNHHRRECLNSWDIPPEVRAQFDYVDWAACDDGRDSVSFVRAYGEWWDLNDTEPGPGMTRMPDSLSEWHAYVSETFFSGVVFRYVFDSDDGGEYTIVVGRYFAADDESGYSEQITDGE